MHCQAISRPGVSDLESQVGWRKPLEEAQMNHMSITRSRSRKQDRILLPGDFRVSRSFLVSQAIPSASNPKVPAHQVSQLQVGGV